MSFGSTLRLGLAGILTALSTGCTTPSYTRDLVESGRESIVEIEQSLIDSYYAGLAQKLGKYDILFFGESHPIGVSDSKLQPLGKISPLLRALTDPRVVERPYQTILLESLPLTYNFEGSRRVPIHEQAAISQGKFNLQDTPFIYDFVHSINEFSFGGVRSYFGPVHGIESLEELILDFAGKGVEIKGYLPDYDDVRKTFERASKESVIGRFNAQQRRIEIVNQLSCLMGRSLLSAACDSLSGYVSLGIKPRIIIFGGRMHNDLGSPKAEKDPSYRFVGLREEFSSLFCSYGAVDIVDLTREKPSILRPYLLQKNVKGSKLAKERDLPTLMDSNIVFADHVLVFGEK